MFTGVLGGLAPVSTGRSTHVGLMLSKRRRRWTNIQLKLAQRHVSAGPCVKYLDGHGEGQILTQYWIGVVIARRL